MSMCNLPKLSVVLSHPIQYYSPWFRHISAHGGIDLTVFYLWDFGIQARYDPQFEQAIQWDIPLLDGYRSVFVPNRSRHPGTDRFNGLDNPELVASLVAARPDAILMFGYAFRSHLRVMLSPRLAKVPLLLRGDSHDLARTRGWKARARRLLRRVLFQRFSAFLAVGSANAEYFRNCGVPRSHIHLVPHCVDNDRFTQQAENAAGQAVAWREQLGIAANATVILFAGKFETKKRPLDLLRAFLEIKMVDGAPEVARAVLLFVGAGALEPDLRRMAGDKIGQSVFFAPFHNQSRMPMVYATGDVLVLPSCGEGETWGLAVNEAMNMGLPCIVSSHVGCAADLISEGQTGWVFPAGDIDALAGVLRSALQAGPEALRRMGALARAHVQTYSYEAATIALRSLLVPHCVDSSRPTSLGDV